MGLFRSKSARLLPSNIVELTERFGRHEIDPQSSGDANIWTEVIAPFADRARSDPTGFVTALAAVCLPAGGWATYGAERMVIELVGLDPPGPAWPQLLDASIDFLRANGVPPMRVPGYMWTYWVNQGGSANSWIPPRPAPTREEARITDLAEGQVRRIVQFGPGDANTILARRDNERYVALIDARYSDEDPTRSQTEWKHADTLYDLFLEVGISTQMYYWADPEFEPFLPLPKSAI